MDDETREAALPQIHEGPVEGFVPDTPDSYPVARTFPAYLPSGAKMLLRRPNILSLMQRGDIPNPLIGVVQKAFAEGELSDKARDLAKRAELAGRSPEEQITWERDNGIGTEDDERMGELVADAMEDVGADEALSYIDVIVFGSVVAPALTFLPPTEPGGKVAADGKLSLAAVEDGDKLFIFQWANSQLDGLATFREAGAGADLERDGGEVRAEAEQPAGDPAHA